MDQWLISAYLGGQQLNNDDKYQRYNAQGGYVGYEAHEQQGEPVVGSQKLSGGEILEQPNGQLAQAHAGHGGEQQPASPHTIHQTDGAEQAHHLGSAHDNGAGIRVYLGVQLVKDVRGVVEECEAARQLVAEDQQEVQPKDLYGRQINCKRNANK